MSNTTSKDMVFVLNSIAVMVTRTWVQYEEVTSEGQKVFPQEGCKHNTKLTNPTPTQVSTPE